FRDAYGRLQGTGVGGWGAGYQYYATNRNLQPEARGTRTALVARSRSLASLRALPYARTRIPNRVNRLRNRLIVIFLAATLAPLAATLWITMSLLELSLSYASTGELDEISK